MQLVVARHVVVVLSALVLQHHNPNAGIGALELGDELQHVDLGIGTLSIICRRTVRLDQVLASVDVGEAADFGDDRFALAAVDGVRVHLCFLRA